MKKFLQTIRQTPYTNTFEAKRADEEAILDGNINIFYNIEEMLETDIYIFIQDKYYVVLKVVAQIEYFEKEGKIYRLCIVYME
jgi:hypothetical protein